MAEDTADTMQEDEHEKAAIDAAAASGRSHEESAPIAPSAPRPADASSNAQRRIRTGDVVSSAKSFADLMVPAELVGSLAAAGFTTPSPVQQAAIPLGRLGADLIVQAKSGTGKTVTFAVIVLERIKMDISAPQVQCTCMRACGDPCNPCTMPCMRAWSSVFYLLLGPMHDAIMDMNMNAHCILITHAFMHTCMHHEQSFVLSALYSLLRAGWWRACFCRLALILSATYLSWPVSRIPAACAHVAAVKLPMQALILAPTREIAIQSEQVINKLISGLPEEAPRPSCAVFVGGLNIVGDEKRLRRLVHVAVGTPGRICSLLQSGALPTKVRWARATGKETRA